MLAIDKLGELVMTIGLGELVVDLFEDFRFCTILNSFPLKIHATRTSAAASDHYS